MRCRGLRAIITKLYDKEKIKYHQIDRFDRRGCRVAYMSLGEFHDSTNAGYIDYTRSVAFDVSRPFVQQSQECIRDEEDRERINFV